MSDLSDGRYAGRALAREFLVLTVVAAAALCGWPAIAAPAALLLLAYFPGRAVLGVLGIGRDWTLGGRALLSAAASIAFTPVVLNVVWQYSNAAWPSVISVWLATMALAFIARASAGAAPTGGCVDGANTSGVGAGRYGAAPVDGAATFAGRWVRILAGLIGCSIVATGLFTYWPAEVGGGPVPAPIHDFIKHHAVLLSLEQHALPLGNPFFAVGADEAVYYYHLFYLIPATVRAAAPVVSIQLAFALGGVLVSLATTGLCYLLAHRIFGGERPAILAAALASVVGGLDIVMIVAQRMPAITLDTWADHPLRLHSLPSQMLWTPQNVQGLMICLLAAYLLSRSGWSRTWIVLGPVLAAGLVGSSIWVAAIALPAATVWVAFGLLSDRALAARRTAAAAIVAVLMLALAWPMLAGYVETSRRHDSGLTMQWPHSLDAVFGKFVPAGPLANLLDLPWILAIELGALLIFPLLRPRAIFGRAWGDGGGRFLIMAAVISIAAFATFRSHFTYNDFGQKAMMLAMAAGAILGGGVVADFRFSVFDFRFRAGLRDFCAGWLIVALIALGLPVALWQQPLTALRRFVPPESRLGSLASPAMRLARQESAALRFLKHQSPRDAVVQAHWDNPRLELGQLIDRQIGVMVLQEDTHVFQAADAGPQLDAVELLKRVLEAPLSSATTRETLQRLRVTHVLVGAPERQKWTGLERFDDREAFEPVFQSPAATVYRVRE